MKVAIKFQGGIYAAFVNGGGKVVAIARNRHQIVSGSGMEGEQSAYRFLGDHGLPRRQARRLLDAAIRNEGPFADPNHPRRLKDATAQLPGA